MKIFEKEKFNRTLITNSLESTDINYRAILNNQCLPSMVGPKKQRILLESLAKLSSDLGYDPLLTLPIREFFSMGRVPLHKKESKYSDNLKKTISEVTEEVMKDFIYDKTKMKIVMNSKSSYGSHNFFKVQGGVNILTKRVHDRIKGYLPLDLTKNHKSDILVKISNYLAKMAMLQFSLKNTYQCVSSGLSGEESLKKGSSIYMDIKKRIQSEPSYAKIRTRWYKDPNNIVKELDTDANYMARYVMDKVKNKPDWGDLAKRGMASRIRAVFSPPVPMNGIVSLVWTQIRDHYSHVPVYNGEEDLISINNKYIDKYGNKGFSVIILDVKNFDSNVTAELKNAFRESFKKYIPFSAFTQALPFDMAGLPMLKFFCDMFGNEYILSSDFDYMCDENIVNLPSGIHLVDAFGKFIGLSMLIDPILHSEWFKGTTKDIVKNDTFKYGFSILNAGDNNVIFCKNDILDLLLECVKKSEVEFGTDVNNGSIYGYGFSDGIFSRNANINKSFLNFIIPESTPRGVSFLGLEEKLKNSLFTDRIKALDQIIQKHPDSTSGYSLLSECFDALDQSKAYAIKENRIIHFLQKEGIKNKDKDLGALNLPLVSDEEFVKQLIDGASNAEKMFNSTEFSIPLFYYNGVMEKNRLEQDLITDMLKVL